ncbi:MAG: TonB-dependent receptor [Marinilabiliaceae bacterium]
MKKIYLIVTLAMILIPVIFQTSFAQEQKEAREGKSQKLDDVLETQPSQEKDDSVFPSSTTTNLEGITVTAPRQEKDVMVSPSATTINIESYKIPGTSKNVVDILKNRAIIDFRGQSDLVPEKDDINMRGFDAHRFTTAIDGMTLDYGRNAYGGTRTSVVDFASLPIGQIESIEIMPGPHSALYGAKSMGGVINLKTKTPEIYTTLKPDFTAMTSYRSYDTQTHTINVDGGAGPFNYGLFYQYYHTDGYLRNNSTDISNCFARFGYVLPSDGYISFNAAYVDKYKEDVAKNVAGGVDYDSDYPETPETNKYAWTDRNTDSYEYAYRLNFKQPSRFGLWTLGTYYANQDWKLHYFREKDTGKTPEVKPDEIERYGDSSTNRQAGLKIQNEIEIFEDNMLTVGFDSVYMWEMPTNFNRHEKHKIYYCNAGYLQDKWTIIPRLTLTAGLRYEDVSYWRSNWDSGKNTFHITGEGSWVRRDSNQLIPKSFLTYALGDLSDMFKDTTVSLGVSKIWNPTPFCYG